MIRKFVALTSALAATAASISAANSSMAGMSKAMSALESHPIRSKGHRGGGSWGGKHNRTKFEREVVEVAQREYIKRTGYGQGNVWRRQ